MTQMMRLLGRRWLWGIAGAAATVYLLRRSQNKRSYRSKALTNFTTEDAMRMGRNALDTAIQAGKTVAATTARAVARRN